MIIRKNNGFLLIEILVTVVIVSASIIFINHAFTSSLKAIAVSNDYLSSVLLLEDKSFDFEAYPYVDESSFSGEENFMERNFTWQQDVLGLSEEDIGDEYDEEDLGLKLLRFSVGWKRQNVERNIEVITYTQAVEVQEE